MIPSHPEKRMQPVLNEMSWLEFLIPTKIETNISLLDLNSNTWLFWMLLANDMTKSCCSALASSKAGEPRASSSRCQSRPRYSERRWKYGLKICNNSAVKQLRHLFSLILNFNNTQVLATLITCVYIYTYIIGRFILSKISYYDLTPLGLQSPTHVAASRCVRQTFAWLRHQH